MMKLKQAFFLLFLLSVSFAGPYSCAQDFGTEFIPRMAEPIGIAIGLTVVLIALSYMLASITNNPSFSIFYKDEIFHLFVSAIMLISIGGTFYFTCVASTTFMDQAISKLQTSGSGCYSGFESPQKVAQCYTSKMEVIGKQALKSSVDDSIRQEMDSSYSFGMFNPITGGLFTPLGAYKRAYAMQLDTVANTFITPALISISVQKLFMQFSNDVVAFIIPIGLFFRFIPLTRQMGNMFLALALGIYVILPVIYAVNGVMDEYIFSHSCDNSIVGDLVMGDCNSPYGFWNIARIIPYAYFLPNLTLAIFITFMAAINKALKVIT